jgi:tRNA A37 threonylcarbamoyladenosine dehydratase
MGKERYDGQLDLVDNKRLSLDIHLIGAGGIGSWTALALAKMGCSNIFVYDDDTVEDHNVASQFFKETQLGELKVVALKENVYEQTGVNINPIDDIRIENSLQDGLIIFAIDSMAERIRLGELYADKKIYIIDGRMGGLQAEVYTCDSSNYLKTTVDPALVSSDLCTAKAISFNCMVIGGLIANAVRQYTQGNLKNSEITFGFNNIEFYKAALEFPIKSQTDNINT